MIQPENHRIYIHFVGDVQHHNCKQNCEIDVGNDVADEFDDRGSADSTVERK